MRVDKMTLSINSINSKIRQAVGLNKHPPGSDSWLMSPSVLSPPQDRVPNLIGCKQSILTSMNRIFVWLAKLKPWGASSLKTILQVCTKCQSCSFADCRAIVLEGTEQQLN